MEDNIKNILQQYIIDKQYYSDNNIKLPIILQNVDFLTEDSIDFISEQICNKFLVGTDLIADYDNIFEEICNILYVNYLGYRYEDCSDEIWVIDSNRISDVAKIISDFLKKSALNS